MPLSTAHEGGVDFDAALSRWAARAGFTRRRSSATSRDLSTRRIASATMTLFCAAQSLCDQFAAAEPRLTNIRGRAAGARPLHLSSPRRNYTHHSKPHRRQTTPSNAPRATAGRACCYLERAPPAYSYSVERPHGDRHHELITTDSAPRA